MNDRISLGVRLQEGRWRSVIRVFAVVIAVLGLILIGNEILENVTSCGAAGCSRIHLGTMLWGVTLLSLGLLILQKGDVALSLEQAATTGTIVRGWFTRSGRASDLPGTKVTTVVTPPIPPVLPGPPVERTSVTITTPAAFPTMRDD